MNNEIKINKNYPPNMSFGVYSNVVIPPDSYVCKKNDRMFSRFFYIKKGMILFNRGTENEIRAGKGDIVFLPSDVTYRSAWDTSDKGEYITLHFNMKEGYVSLPNELCIIAKDNKGIYGEMFENLLEVWERGALGYELEILSGIYRVIHQIFCDMTYKKIKNKNSIIYPGILYLENHYLEDVTVEQLAKMCNTSEGNFRRLFKKYKKMPPVSYRNYLRIKKAAILINSGECNVGEAARAVNISDICYFNKIFKKIYGKTPREFINIAK